MEPGDGSWRSRRAELRRQKAHGEQKSYPGWLRKLRRALNGLSEGPWRDMGYVRFDPPDWETGRGHLAAEAPPELED